MLVALPGTHPSVPFCSSNRGSAGNRKGEEGLEVVRAEGTIADFSYFDFIITAAKVSSACSATVPQLALVLAV